MPPFLPSQGVHKHTRTHTGTRTHTHTERSDRTTNLIISFNVHFVPLAEIINDQKNYRQPLRWSISRSTKYSTEKSVSSDSRNSFFSARLGVNSRHLLSMTRNVLAPCWSRSRSVKSVSPLQRKKAIDFKTLSSAMWGPAYRQTRPYPIRSVGGVRWAHRWIDHLSPWRMASATPDLRLPSQPQNIKGLLAHTKLYCLVNRGTCVWTTCPAQGCYVAYRLGVEPAILGLQVRRVTVTLPA